jgi:hypothetical protein
MEELYIVLVNWNNSPRVDISPHSVPSQPVFLLNSCVFSEGLANTNFVVFDLTPSEIKLTTARRANYTTNVVRDRPFNLQVGVGGRGVMVFCFVQNFFSGYTRVRIFFFQNLTLGYMTKTLNQIIFFFSSTKITIFFSSNIGNQNIFSACWMFVVM